MGNGNIVWGADKGWHDGDRVTVGLDGRGRIVSCEHPGSNHSSDLIEVWSGRPTPRYVCGFHQSQELLD